MTLSFAFPVLTRDEVFRIETPRLWLRWPRLEDAAVMAKWVGLPEVAEMTSSFPVGMTSAEIGERLQRQREANTLGKALGFAVVLKRGDRQAVGMVGVGLRSDGVLELGYHLDPGHWNKGLMTEAVRALAAQAFELSAVEAIHASVKPANAGSIRVLEKSGFVAQGENEHESLVHGRYVVRSFSLARSRPSSLLAAQLRFHPTRMPGPARIEALAS